MSINTYQPPRRETRPRLRTKGTLFLIVSTLSAWLTLLGLAGLLGGITWRAFDIGGNGSPIWFLIGLILLIGGIALFGCLLSLGWRGPLSVACGYLVAVATIIVVPTYDILKRLIGDGAFPVAIALLGSIVAVTALVISQFRDARDVIGIGMGAIVSMTLAHVVLMAMRIPQSVTAFVWGWVSVVFFWLVLTRQAKWWDGLVWIGLLAISLALALELGV